MSTREYLAVALLGAAYALVIDHTGGSTDPGFLLTMVMVAAAFCLCALPIVSGIGTRLSVHHAMLAGFLLTLVLLIYTSSLASNSLIIGWRLATFAFVFFVFFRHDQVGWHFGLLLFLMVGAVSAGWGIIEFLVTGLRANGPIIDPSSWGAIQNLCFFATAAVFLSMTFEKRWKQAIVVATLTLFATASFAAYSRVGTLIFLAALMFVVSLGLPLAELRKKCAALLVVAVVSFAIVNLTSPAPEATNHEEGFTLDVESFGWSQRFLMWESALDIYTEYPVFGSGPGTFKLHYPRYRSLEEKQNSGNYVHNDYLQFLSEGGPLLLAFLLAFSGWLVYQFVLMTILVWRGERRSLEPLILVVALGTPLTHALMNFPLYQQQILMLMGLLYARVAYLRSPSQEFVLQARSPQLNRAAVVVIVALALMPVAFDVLTLDLVRDEDEVPILHRLGDDSDRYLATMSFLSSVRSQNALNRFAMATIYRTTFDQLDPRTQGDARESLAAAAALEYQRGVELDPWNGVGRRYFAEFLAQNPWLSALDAIESTPDSLFRGSIEISPSSLAPYLQYATWLEQQGRTADAYQLLLEKAWPWADHRGANWRANRVDLAARVSRTAISRGDEVALRRVLELLGR